MKYLNHQCPVNLLEEGQREGFKERGNSVREYEASGRRIRKNVGLGRGNETLNLNDFPRIWEHM